MRQFGLQANPNFSGGAPANSSGYARDFASHRRKIRTKFGALRPSEAPESIRKISLLSIDQRLGYFCNTPLESLHEEGPALIACCNQALSN